MNEIDDEMYSYLVKVAIYVLLNDFMQHVYLNIFKYSV